MRATRLPVLIAAVAVVHAGTACMGESTPTSPAPDTRLGKTSTVVDPTATFFLPTGTSAGVGGDGFRLAVDGRTTYENGDCGISTRIFATTNGSGSGDATMQTNNPVAKNKQCAAYPRKITLRYTNEAGVAVVDTRAVFMNLRSIATVGSAMQIGDTKQTILAISLSGTGAGCSELRWNPVFGGVANDASLVTVERVDAVTYRAYTLPGQRAYCADNGLTYDIPVSLTVVSSRAI